MNKITRAISIRQPFVEAILDGKKTIEYRSRKTNIRERVYIYASLGMRDKEDYEEYGYKPEECPRGVIVGSVEISDCTGVDGDYEIHLANPERLEEFLLPLNQPQPMFWIPRFEPSLNDRLKYLKKIPSHLFKGKTPEEKILLLKLKIKMTDELAAAFGGDTSGGGYNLDDDLWDEVSEKQLVFLENLHSKYEAEAAKIKSRKN